MTLSTGQRNESISNRWESGVNQLYVGCRDVFAQFSGPTYDIADTVINSFKIYVDQLGSLTNCNSTLLSMRSAEILDAISLLSKLGKSRSNILHEFDKGVVKVSSSYRKIVLNLSNIFGRLITHTVNEAITDLEKSFIGIIKQYQSWEEQTESKLQYCANIDFEHVMKSAQLLTNTISLIAETVLNDTGRVTTTNETYEAIAVLILILNHLILCVEGVNVIIGSELDAESQGISDFLLSCLLSLYPFIHGMTQSVSSITYDVAKSVRVLLTSLVDLTRSLNEILGNLLGVLKGVAKFTVGQIKKNLVNLTPIKKLYD